VVNHMGPWEDMGRVTGRAQGYFTRAGLQGWGMWEAWLSPTKSVCFEGEFPVRKGSLGIWDPDRYRSFVKSFADAGLRGPAQYLDGPTGCMYPYVYDGGSDVTHHLAGVWEQCF
jgi:hypothetical protein